jgi:autotransporter-associated beta strand protein
MITISKRIAQRLALALGFALAPVSRAAIYTVTNAINPGAGSLAQTLALAQSDTNAVINLEPGLEPIVLSGALPPIENNLVINGNGNTIRGANSYRIFFVNAPGNTVEINGLTLVDGMAQGGNGGAGQGGGGGGAGLGGAIFLNAGSLTVSNAVFSSNSAHGGDGMVGYDGGVGQSGGGGGGGGLDFDAGAGGSEQNSGNGIYVGPGGGGGALTSAGLAGNYQLSHAGMGGGVNGGQGGALGLDGNAGNGASPTLPDGGGGGGGLASDVGNGGNGGNGSDFGGGGGAGSSTTQDSGQPGAGGFGGGGGGGADTVNGAYGGGNGGFGGGGGGSGYGGESSGLGGAGGFGGGNGANSATGSGGGGLGAGGAIFARLGSTLAVEDCKFNGDTVFGGTSGSTPATGGAAIGQALFLGANVNFCVSGGTNVLGETIGGGNDANAQGSFIKSGAGTLVLTNLESYHGSTIVSNGVLEIANNLLPSSSAMISSNGVLDYNYSSRIITAGTIAYTGTGTLRADGAGGQVVFGPGPTYVNFSPGALINVEAGILFGSSSWQGYWANNFASINVASNAIFDAVEAGYAAAMQIDALTGAGTFQGGYSGNANGGLTTLTIGVAGGSGTFGGRLLDDASARLGIVKVGAGTEILTGANNMYSGNTTVGGGTLVINGNAGTGPVTVTNGTLAGTGTIAGAVVVGANGTLAPGWPTGTLTLTESLTLAGTTRMALNSGAHSQIAGLAKVSYGGALVITNLGGPLSLGDTFNLFSAGSWSGNFASVTASAGNGLGFSFNPTNGVLSVVSGLPTTPTSLYYSMHSGSLTVNWPANYTGWILQAQTNNCLRGLGTNWADVSGSAAVNSMSFPVSSTNCVFFRLRLP